MKAAVLHGREDLRIEDLVEPELQPGEARLRIEAALTCGTDLKVYRRGSHARMLTPPSPFGHEMAGVVLEIHPGTAGLALGDRVVVANSAPCGGCPPCLRGQANLCDDLQFLNGAYAERLVIPARFVEKNVVQLKPQTAFADAALTEPLACVAQGMADLRPARGETAVILGSGPIGLMFLALLKDAGCQVSMVGRGARRLELAERLGAKSIFAAGPGGSMPESLEPALRSLRADMVVEAVGKPETWELAARIARKGGRVNFFGGCASGTRVSLDTGLVHYSNLTLLASFHHTPATIREALGHIERGAVRAADFVDGTCALEDLPAHFRSMAQGNQTVKTLVVGHGPG